VRASRPAEPIELTEADVVHRAQQGDAAAFERLYRLYSRKVYALCLRMAGNPTEAEDLTQDVFLQLFRKIGTFRGESAFSTWLHRMSVNIVLMRFRQKPKAEMSLDTITGPEEESSRLPEEFGGPDLRLNGVIDRLTLQAAIDELAPGYRAMFILHDVQGYKHDEIARMFGCSAGNSKSQVHKARMQLRGSQRKALGDRRRPHGSLKLGELKYFFDGADA
jgi:RNA polymerase sigma-70 factor, ECF subfamily